jgi:hypothetical protein
MEWRAVSDDAFSSDDKIAGRRRLSSKKKAEITNDFHHPGELDRKSSAMKSDRPSRISLSSVSQQLSVSSNLPIRGYGLGFPAP